MNINYPAAPKTSTTTCTHPEHNPKVGVIIGGEGLTHRCPGCGYSFHVSAFTLGQAATIIGFVPDGQPGFNVR